jgi:hypothetical protein
VGKELIENLANTEQHKNNKKRKQRGGKQSKRNFLKRREGEQR